MLVCGDVYIGSEQTEQAEEEQDRRSEPKKVLIELAERTEWPRQCSGQQQVGVAVGLEVEHQQQMSEPWQQEVVLEVQVARQLQRFLGRLVGVEVRAEQQQQQEDVVPWSAKVVVDLPGPLSGRRYEGD
jgi:hypothetical protein